MNSVEQLEKDINHMCNEAVRLTGAFGTVEQYHKAVQNQNMIKDFIANYKNQYHIDRDTLDKMKTGKMNWDSMFEGHALDDARCEGWDQAIEKIKQNTTQTEQGKQSWK